MTFIELWRSNRQYRKLLILWAARSLPAYALGLLLLWSAVHNDSMLRGGIVSAVYALTGMIVPFVLAWLSDRTGRRVPMLAAAVAELVALPMVLIAATTGATGPILEVAAFVSSAGGWTFAVMRGTSAVDVATGVNPDSGPAAVIGVGFAGDVPKLASVPLIWLLISHNGPVVAAALSLFTLAGIPLAYVLPNAKAHRAAAASDTGKSTWSMSSVLPGIILLGVVSLVPWNLVLVATPSSPAWLAVDLAAAFLGALVGTGLLTISKTPTMASTSCYAVLHVVGLLVAVTYPSLAPVAFAGMGVGTAGTWQSLRAITIGATPLHRRGFVAAVSGVLAAIAAAGSRLATGAGFDIIGGLLTVEIMAVTVLGLVAAVNVWLLTGSRSHQSRLPRWRRHTGH